MWKKFLKAARFAREAHGSQTRAGGAPYYWHPMAVARILWDNGHRDPDLLRAAYLHDVLEDTKVSSYELNKLFNWGTVTLVRAVTRPKGEPHEDYYRRVKAAGYSAMALKLADREHNNSDLGNAPENHTQLREKAAKKTALMLKVFNN